MDVALSEIPMNYELKNETFLLIYDTKLGPVHMSAMYGILRIGGKGKQRKQRDRQADISFKLQFLQYTFTYQY